MTSLYVLNKELSYTEAKYSYNCIISFKVTLQSCNSRKHRDCCAMDCLLFRLSFTCASTCSDVTRPPPRIHEGHQPSNLRDQFKNTFHSPGLRFSMLKRMLHWGWGSSLNWIKPVQIHLVIHHLWRARLANVHVISYLCLTCTGQCTLCCWEMRHTHRLTSSGQGYRHPNMSYVRRGWPEGNLLPNWLIPLGAASKLHFCFWELNVLDQCHCNTWLHKWLIWLWKMVGF